MAEDDTVAWSGGAGARRVSHDRDREVRVSSAFYIQADGLPGSCRAGPCPNGPHRPAIVPRWAMQFRLCHA
jgi:hypothetical protein